MNNAHGIKNLAGNHTGCWSIPAVKLHEVVGLSLKGLTQCATQDLTYTSSDEAGIFVYIFLNWPLQTYLSAMTCFRSGWVRKQLPFVIILWSLKISSARPDKKDEEALVKLSIFSTDSKLGPYMLNNICDSSQFCHSPVFPDHLHSSMFTDGLVCTQCFGMNRCMDSLLACLNCWKSVIVHIILIHQEKLPQ